MDEQERKAKRAAYAREWAAKNRDKLKAAHKRWRDANPDKPRERTREWRAANPERAKAAVKKAWDKNRERYYANFRAYCAAHPEKTREWNRQNYLKHKADRDARNRQWVKDHPEERKAHARAYYKRNPAKVQQINRARKQKLIGRYTDADVRRITEEQGGKCFYCGVATKLVVDHYVPVSRGGTNWPDNLRMACHRCNSAKGNKLAEEWRS